MSSQENGRKPRQTMQDDCLSLDEMLQFSGIFLFDTNFFCEYDPLHSLFEGKDPIEIPVGLIEQEINYLGKEITRILNSNAGIATIKEVVLELESYNSLLNEQKEYYERKMQYVSNEEKTDAEYNLTALKNLTKDCSKILNQLKKREAVQHFSPEQRRKYDSIWYYLAFNFAINKPHKNKNHRKFRHKDRYHTDEKLVSASVVIADYSPVRIISADHDIPFLLDKLSTHDAVKKRKITSYAYFKGDFTRTFPGLFNHASDT